MKGALDGEESVSALITAPRGSGKSHAVNVAVEEMGERVLAVTLNGADYQDERSCMRDLFVQLGKLLRQDYEPTEISGTSGYRQSAGSFSAWMHKLVGLLHDSTQAGFLVFVILDRFELFVRQSSQTILYNLFDMMQTPNIRLVCVGLTDVLGITDHLEKRIKSRFQLRAIYLHPPSCTDSLTQFLVDVFVSTTDLTSTEVERILRSRELRAAVEQFVDEGVSVGEAIKTVTQSIVTCGTLDQLEIKMRGSFDEFNKKRKLVSYAGVLSVLGELRIVDHVIISALLRLHKNNKRPKTFAALCSEISSLEKSANSHNIVKYTKSQYLKAFVKLVDLGIIKRTHPSTDSIVPLAFVPCTLTIVDLYVDALEKAHDQLKFIPDAVTSWASDTIYQKHFSSANN